MRRCGGSVGIFFRIFLLIELNRNFGFFAKFPANQRISPCKNVSAREHKPNHKNPFRVERMQSKNVALCYTQGSSRLSTTLSYLEKSRCSGVGCVLGLPVACKFDGIWEFRRGTNQADAILPEIGKTWRVFCLTNFRNFKNWEKSQIYFKNGEKLWYFQQKLRRTPKLGLK